MTAAKTNASRQSEFVARRALDGIKKVNGIFAHVGDHADIKAYAAKLARKRERVKKKAP